MATRSIQNRDDAFDMMDDMIQNLMSIPEVRDFAQKQQRILYISYYVRNQSDEKDPRFVKSEKALLKLKPHIPKEYSWKQKVMLLLFWYCRKLFDFFSVQFKRRQEIK